VATGLEGGAQFRHRFLADEALGFPRAADDGPRAVDDRHQPVGGQRLVLQQRVQLAGEDADIEGVDDLAPLVMHGNPHGHDRLVGQRPTEKVGEYGLPGFEDGGELRWIAAFRQWGIDVTQGVEHLSALAVDQHIVVGGLRFQRSPGDLVKAPQVTVSQLFRGGQHVQAGFHHRQFTVELDENLPGQRFRLADDLRFLELVIDENEVGRDRQAGQDAGKDQHDQAGSQRYVARRARGERQPPRAGHRVDGIARPAFCLLDAHENPPWRTSSIERCRNALLSFGHSLEARRLGRSRQWGFSRGR